MNPRRLFMAIGLATLAAATGGCASTSSGGWLTLVDGASMKNFDGFSPVGAGNWSFTEGTLQVAKVAQPYPKAANRWNSFDISARRDRLVVAFNGVQTEAVRDPKFKAGPVALQSAGGTIRWRKVQIRVL